MSINISSVIEKMGVGPKVFEIVALEIESALYVCLFG